MRQLLIFIAIVLFSCNKKELVFPTKQTAEPTSFIKEDSFRAYITNDTTIKGNNDHIVGFVNFNNPGSFPCPQYKSTLWGKRYIADKDCKVFAKLHLWMDGTGSYRFAINKNSNILLTEFVETKNLSGLKETQIAEVNLKAGEWIEFGFSGTTESFTVLKTGSNFGRPEDFSYFEVKSY